MFTFGRSSFWRQVTPGLAMRDFVTLWRENPYRWRVLAASIALTGLMIYGFLPDTKRAPPERMQVTWITTFAPNRSEAEIVASNIASEKRKEEAEAEEAKRLELQKQFFRDLGRASGFDVEALEKQYSDKPAAKATPGGPVAGHD